MGSRRSWKQLSNNLELLFRSVGWYATRKRLQRSDVRQMGEEQGSTRAGLLTVGKMGTEGGARAGRMGSRAQHNTILSPEPGSFEGFIDRSSRFG